MLKSLMDLVSNLNPLKFTFKLQLEIVKLLQLNLKSSKNYYNPFRLVTESTAGLYASHWCL